MADKEKENNKDAVETFVGSPDSEGFVSIEEVYKYNDGPWWSRILFEYEPEASFRRSIIHRYNQPNDTLIATPAGTAYSLYYSPTQKLIRSTNFDDINKIFTNTFNNAGYEMVLGSKPRPKFIPEKNSKTGVPEPIEIQVEQVTYDKKGGTINYTKLF